MFRGIEEINIDAKGRMAMPTRFRELVLSNCSGHLVVTIDISSQCLLLYPIAEWEQIERQIESLPSLDPMSQRVKHLLIGHAKAVDLDGSGRVLLPANLRSYTKVEKRVCLIGQGKKLEIWDQDIWNKQREKWLSETAMEGELSDKLRALSL